MTDGNKEHEGHADVGGCGPAVEADVYEGEDDDDDLADYDDDREDAMTDMPDVTDMAGMAFDQATDGRTR